MVKVGKVSRRTGARYHLALHGLAYCGAGTGRTIGAGVDITADHAPLICLRCAAAIRRHLDDAQQTAAMSPATADRIADARWALRTPAEIAEADAAAAVILVRLTLPEPAASVVPFDWRAWLATPAETPAALVAA